MNEETIAAQVCDDIRAVYARDFAAPKSEARPKLEHEPLTRPRSVEGALIVNIRSGVRAWRSVFHAREALGGVIGAPTGHLAPRIERMQRGEHGAAVFTPAAEHSEEYFELAGREALNMRIGPLEALEVIGAEPNGLWRESARRNVSEILGDDFRHGSIVPLRIRV